MNDNAEQISPVILCEESAQPLTQDVDNPETTTLQQQEGKRKNPRSRSKLIRLLHFLFVRYEKLNIKNAQYIFDDALEEITITMFLVGRILLYVASVLFLANSIPALKTAITDPSVKSVLSVVVSILFWFVAFLYGRIFYFMWKELSGCSKKETAIKAANVLSLFLAVFSCFLAILSIA